MIYVLVASFFLGAGFGCDCCAGCRVGSGPGLIFSLLSLDIKMKNKILKSIKTEGP